MVPAVSAYLIDARHSNPTYWAAKREACLAAVYPTTPALEVTKEMWTHARLADVPLSASWRYVCAEPGGRSGGSVAYVHRLDPITPAASPRCLVFHAGHGYNDPVYGGWSGSLYMGDDGSSVVRRMLSRGWYVLAVDLPNYGLQPLPQSAIINGALVTQTAWSSHAPKGSVAPFGGPSITRLYTDHVLAAMDAMAAELPGMRFALVGHSGGGAAAQLLAGVDDRFVQVHLLQSMTASPSYVGSADEWEYYVGSDIRAAAQYVPGQGGSHDLTEVAATVPGRTVYVHAGDADEYEGDQHVYWSEFCANRNAWVSTASAGSSLRFVRWSSGHNPTAPQAAFVEAELLKV